MATKKKKPSKKKGRPRLLQWLFNPKTVVFAICVAIASVLWFLNALSGVYTGQIVVDLNYRNLPEDKILVRPLQEELYITVQSVGYNLLLANLNFFQNEAVIDYDNYAGYERISTSEVLGDLAAQLSQEYEVLNTYPDSLFFYFDDKSEKKVPVKLISDITYEKQFYLSDSVKLNPDSVTISGPEAVIDTIDEWPTERVELAELNETIVQNVMLQQSADANIDLSVSSVETIIPVEQFTEQTLEVKVIKLNEPEGLEVVLLPTEVSLTFQVPLSKYEKVNEGKFEAVVDFEDFDIFANQKIAVQLNQAPPYIKGVTINPDYVTYIIYR